MLTSSTPDAHQGLGVGETMLAVALSMLGVLVVAADASMTESATPG